MPEDDEEEDENQIMEINPDSVDEKASALHCLGFLVRFVPQLMVPYMDETTVEVDKIAQWYHPNI